MPDKDAGEGVKEGKNPLRLDYSAKARPGAYDVAQFRMWLPDAAMVPRALLILMPGFEGDGRGMADSREWQEFAAKHKLGIVACFFKGGDYQNPASGSGEALDEAIKDLAVQSKHSEITSLNFVMWGHSAGGQVNYNYVQWRPEKVLTFVVNKGAYYTANRERKANDVPGLFFLGLKDAELRIGNIRGIFEEGRKKNAPWCLIEEPGEAHGVGRSEDFARAYFDVILPLRLPENAERPVRVDLSSGWLGNLKDKNIGAANISSWKPAESAWLPNEDLAQRWQKIVKTN